MSSLKSWISNLRAPKPEPLKEDHRYTPGEEFISDLRNNRLYHTDSAAREAAQTYASELNKYILTHLYVYQHHHRISSRKLSDGYSLDELLGNQAKGLELYNSEDVSSPAHLMEHSGALQKLHSAELVNLARNLYEYSVFRDSKHAKNQTHTIDKKELNSLLDSTMLEMTRRDLDWPLSNINGTARPLPIAVLLSSTGKELQHKALHALLDVAGTNDTRTSEQSKHLKTLYSHLLDVTNDIPRSTLNNIGTTQPTSKLLTMVDNLRDKSMDEYTAEGLRVIPHHQALEEMIATTHHLGMTSVSMRLSEIAEDGTGNQPVHQEQKLVHLAINLNNPRALKAALCNGDHDDQNNVDSNALPYTLNAVRLNATYLDLVPVLLSNECQQGVNVKAWARHVVGFGSEAWTAAINKATPDQRANIRQAIQQNNALSSIQPFKESLLRELDLNQFSQQSPTP